MIELPFQTEAFFETWTNWCQHRKEKKKPLTPTSVRMQLKRLSDIGEQRAILAIEHSIASGYQGIFEPTTKPSFPFKGGDRAASFLQQGASVPEGGDG